MVVVASSQLSWLFPNSVRIALARPFRVSPLHSCGGPSLMQRSPGLQSCVVLLGGMSEPPYERGQNSVYTERPVALMASRSFCQDASCIGIVGTQPPAGALAF